MDRDLRDQPPCAELRSKRYYFLERAPASVADILDASNDCWCARTSAHIGPDGDVVAPELCCGPERGCFRPGPSHGIAARRVEAGGREV
ncbi:MAG TPA: hypothetical protein VMS76_17625 [Planctomycetota bacterium]|nr:hypothetical protein [Planctomycetota bacterium]